MNIIDPWKSVEVKDYGKLMKEFGISPIKDLYKKLPIKHHYFSRGIIFGHKDFSKILEAIKDKKPFVMMTGLMPSGKFHLGHKVVADIIIYLQKLGAECYVAVADIEATLTRDVKREEARKVALDQYLLNYIALGLKSKKTKFYFQSNGSTEYNNLSKYVSKKTTFNEFKSVYGNLNPEKIISAFTQVADILHPQLKENGGPKPVIVPVGVDQLPHINLTRDIASRMKSEYNFVLPSSIFNKMLPGLQGGKMSSSRPESYIALTDSPKTVEMKIKKYAFSGGQPTTKEHKEKGGNPDVDISYQYLTFLEESDKKLKKIYDDYKSGKLLTSELKQITIDKINSFLKKHQDNRKKAKKKVNKFIFKN
ncbi:tryptophan--tRNA ligase [archaeon]|nr:tryptophan--tRNA ligase [archaeon]|tara:strand:+ start:945 stop:2039 length:1095 start_codon:yes stop_codon:yes gene_type:complete